VTDALDRGVGAVRHREGVVDEDIAERGKLRDESGIVALLARMEAGVLQGRRTRTRVSRLSRCAGGLQEGLPTKLA
jgi:hypothetical protein